MQHDLKLYGKNFDRMELGNKLREYRLYDEKRKLIKVGDTIRFIKLPDKDKFLYADVTNIEIFEKNTSSKKTIVILFILLSLIISFGIPAFQYAGLNEAVIVLGITLFYTMFLALGIFARMPLSMKIFFFSFILLHSFIFYSTLPLIDAFMFEPIYLFGFIVGILCIIGMTIVLKFMPKRTEYGNQALGKIKGFKTFLETAKKTRLEAMVMSNPTYFYDILPYTYVLGVSDKWIKKFETISLQAPDWYDSPSGFNASSFGSFINNTMSSARSAMSSNPSSGGGSSGGGSSGGGSGGGGGGSW